MDVSVQNCPTCATPSPDVALYCWRCNSELDAAPPPKAAPTAEPAPAATIAKPAAEPEPIATTQAPTAAEPALIAEAPEPTIEPITSAPSRCPDCAHAVQPDARFCNNCGASIPRPD
jgi:predicted amidophosphoribosyltransferase